MMSILKKIFEHIGLFLLLVLAIAIGTLIAYVGMDFNSSPTRMVWLARTLSLITPTQGIKVTCYPKFQNRYCDLPI